ncbi:hypothetical protein L1987_13580 [Smallanthus sonchifolius]|uniref:Uncharacterized protein n=1 Tax=Smallanthus sonchifolius TaxID=185202 RepID=A0ACB9JKD9_9ASTR|nr:hypothetical protein L1987_13580 [Smallanthus sonchifolius]
MLWPVCTLTFAGVLSSFSHTFSGLYSTPAPPNLPFSHNKSPETLLFLLSVLRHRLFRFLSLYPPGCISYAMVDASCNMWF